MRRTLVLALTVVALMGVVVPGAYAQAPAAPAAPTPTFKITGFIDELVTYSNNTSNFDFDLHRKDYLFYGRTRGRFDIVGEYGKAKAVLGLELDFAYGQTGTGNSNIATVQGGATPNPAVGNAVAVMPGTDGSFGLNTDVRGILEIKWLYTEFELPYVPVPTVVRLGAQPFGAAASYKLAAYANGDFSGVNIVSTITPNVKLIGTYVAVQEMLVGRQQGTGTNFTQNGTTPVFGQNFLGVNPFQERGDDYAFIFAPEITPIRGLDLKPMASYFIASGTTDGNARQGRGGINATSWFQNTCGGPGTPAYLNGPDCSGNNASGTWRKGIEENRFTMGMDARFRAGGFSLDPTVYYQFGNRSLVAPTLASGAFPLQFLDAGVVPGKKYTSNLSAWFADIRAGYQLGPLLLEAMGMFTTGNNARDTTLRTVKYYQPLDTDTSYLADWGGQLTQLGVDYLDAMLEGAGGSGGINYPGVDIGWDKYGRIQLGARGTYAWTPAFSTYLGVNEHWTVESVQKNAIPLANAGLIPLFTGQSAKNNSNYIGTELFAGLTWRFAPGLALDSAGGYMWTGPALDAVTNPTQGAREAKNVYILTSRIRFSF
ncbi:MAG TPA: hypothetical protein VMS64_30465 [Candidatus Methylomirabilis sp.]|nr:hypothetical protein [Candidatus Methylomirabilis sp.]